MKKYILALTLLSVAAYAEKVQITTQQEKNWNINVEKTQISNSYPLGDFIAQVVTPPTLLHTISLPFEANVKKVNVANYQRVKKGEVLAEVTGTKWIEIQQKAIADAIEFRHHHHLTERKNMLCKEDIIPQKECVAANAELETDKIKVSASKALLQSYGASDKTIEKLFKELKLSNTIDIVSSVDGNIIEFNVRPGKSTKPDDALFVIKQDGPLWLEANIEAERTIKLREGEKVRISMVGNIFNTKVLQLSPVINPENQTRQVRFLLPSNVHIASGLIAAAKFELFADVLKVKKTSVIKQENTQIVFIKTKDGFIATPVEVLAEDENYYYIKPSPRLKNEIAVNSIAILKNLLGANNE
jgi:multidrug efflux pump subunit AcrA (membrane-fusion protein)